MLIKRTKERSPEITPDNRGVIWGKELNGMATDEELYGQYLSGDETGLELLIKKYGDPLTLYIDGCVTILCFRIRQLDKEEQTEEQKGDNRDGADQ